MKLLLETDITKKADKAKTLSGYGIYDAYTKDKANLRFGLNLSVLFDENCLPLKMSGSTIISAGFATLNQRAKYAFISSKVAHISSGSFIDCPNLTDVYIDNEKDKISIDNGVFDSTVTLHYTDNFNVGERILNALASIDTDISKFIAETENLISEKENSSLKVSDIKEITDETKNYPSVDFLREYYYNADETDEILISKADVSSTLAGYGITDSYTRNEADASFASKGELSKKYNADKIQSGSAELITDSNFVTSLSCKYQKIDESVLIQFSFNTAAPTNEEVDITFSGLPFRNDSQVSGICITPVTKLMCSVLVSSYNTTMTVSLPAGIKKGERIATSVFYKIS